MIAVRSKKKKKNKKNKNKKHVAYSFMTQKNYECWFNFPRYSRARYLCARASNIALLISLFYMWSVF